ncbi:MAG: elongation factor G [Lentisphaerota bacterium]
MKDISVADVRNFVLMGHTGSGKTAIVDALLYKLGINDRLGSSNDGSSMADWTDEEKHRKITVWAKPFDGIFKGAGGRKTRLVFVDTPGYADFYGQMVSASAVADAALIVVDATGGIQVGTNRAWRRCEALGLPRAIVITGLDKENADFDAVVTSIQTIWGNKCIPAVIPSKDNKKVVDVLAGKDAGDLKDAAESFKGKLIEAAAESDDTLIEKYLGGDILTPEEVSRGLRGAVNKGKLVPIFAVGSKNDIGLNELMESVCRLLPSPEDRGCQDSEGKPVEVGVNAPFSGFVWRVINDPFVGQLTLIRVCGGTLKPDSEFYNSTKQQKERYGALHYLNGKKQDTPPEAQAGDIVALAKLKTTALNDSLCAIGQGIKFKPIVFPNPVMAYAVLPKTQGDEDKIGTGLHRVADDDPTIRVERNAETKELILAGMGDVHLDVALERMKSRSHVDVVLSTPKVPYKETVTALGEGHYKHKKQSGGRGQYGEVYFKVRPMPHGETEWFVDGLVGMSIPRNYLPAIQKGVVEGMARGALAGYPVNNVQVEVYDGSYHEVDSSEIAFKIASARAFTDGVLKAKPVLLEPIMTLKVMIPDQYLGPINGDLNHKRGRIHGMSTEDGMQVITAEVPQSEILKYSSELRSITAGRGSFEVEFNRYDVVPSMVAQKIIAEAQKNKQHLQEE